MRQRHVHSLVQMAGAFVVCGFIVLFSGCSAPEPETATIVVTSTPAGAKVMVDGTPYGSTPVTIPELALGEHYVILQIQDHRRLNKRITLDVAETVEYNLEMEHFFGEVKFTTTPPGADVAIISKSGPVTVGQTPLEQFELDTGNYTYEIRLANHHTIQGEIEIEDGGYYVQDFPLVAMEAQIQLFSRPTDGDIYINDELRIEKTPATITLLPGEYTVGIYKTGHMIHEESVTLIPNSALRIEAVLKQGNMPLGMVLVPRSEFLFGDDDKSPDEKPRISVLLPDFYMDKYEVTNIQFQDVFPSHKYEEGRDNHPVQNISWKQADEYALAVGKRLPTEQEWEKAARGIEGGEYPWGTIFKPDFLNFLGHSFADSKKVGSYREGISQYGCYDMAGNVYEWVADWYNPYPNNPDVRIDYGTVYKVLRGGSFASDSFEVRSAKRHYNKPEVKREDYGFRCAMDAR